MTPLPEPRVLHVLEALEGGTARHVVDLVTHAAGFEHHVVVPPARIGRPTAASAPSLMAAHGATVHVVSMARTPWHPLNGQALLALRRLVRQVKPAIVHGHSSVGGALGRVVAARSTARAVYTPNAVSPHRLAVWIERSLGRLTDRVIAVSSSEGQLLLDHGIAQEARLRVIPNGIDLDEQPEPVDLRGRLGIAEGAPIVGNVSRLAEQKDPLVFVRAAAIVAQQVPDVHFVLIGTGPLRQAVRDEMGRHDLGDRFHLVEDLQEGAAGALTAFTLLALTSRFEGGPYVPLEAMRAGVPVVAADAVGSRDAVADGVSGVLFPIGDSSALADALVRLLDDPDRRRRFAVCGHERLAEHFDIRETAAATGRLYKELLV